LGTTWLLPTAQTLLAELAATLVNPLDTPGAGLGSVAHFVPSQCSMTVWSALPPTAQASRDETAVTADR
jgi:hypothetical protein